MRPSRQEERILDQFEKIGRDCFLTGLVSSHAGNMSVRTGDRMLITKRGAMLGHLRNEDLVWTAVSEPDERAELASCELPTHRTIYERRGAAGAVLHTHPPHGIVLSMRREVIEPLDAEGRHVVGSVPVVTAERSVGSLEMARVIGDALCEGRLCMLRGHGLFVAGETLEEAFMLTTAFEASARVSVLADMGSLVESMVSGDGS